MSIIHQMKPLALLIILLVSSIRLCLAESIEERAIRLFNPYVQSQGLLGIRINRDLDNTEYTGGADVRDNYLEILFGSQLEQTYPGLTADGYTAIICHEIGHFLAGPWPASEAMSDYFAATICLRKIFQDMGSLPVEQVNPEVKKSCDTQYVSSADRNVCYRSAEAGLNLLKEVHQNFYVINGYRIPFYAMYDLTKKDQFYYENYPSLQCRAEIFAAGAYCKDTKITCKEGMGKRPSCFAN
jgi:hypothetical protein